MPHHTPTPTQWRWLFLLGFFVALFSVASQSLGVRSLLVPPLTAHVMDQTNTLTSEQIQILIAQIKELERDKGTQLVILMVPTTMPENIFDYSTRVANTWKIGRPSVGDGLLVVVAQKERRVRIEVSKALEGAVTDIQAARIIEHHITPSFEKDDFAEGLSNVVHALSTLVREENLPAPAPKSTTRKSFTFLDIASMLAIGGFFVGLVAFTLSFGSAWHKLLVFVPIYSIVLGLNVQTNTLHGADWRVASPLLFVFCVGFSLAMGLLCWGMGVILRGLFKIFKFLDATTVGNHNSGSSGSSALGGSSLGGSSLGGSSLGGSSLGGSSLSDNSSGGGGDFGGGGSSGNW